MDAYRIATFLLRKLSTHHEVDYTPREPAAQEHDERTWQKLAQSRYHFLISSGGKGYKITIQEVELAS